MAQDKGDPDRLLVICFCNGGRRGGPADYRNIQS